MHWNTEESARDPFSPRIGELDAGDFGQNVNPDRRNSDLIHHLLLAECIRGNPVMLDGSPKLLKRSDYPEGILRRVVYPHVEIFRLARLSIFHDREAADNQIFNLKFV